MRPYLLHFHGRPLTLVKFNHDGDFFLTCGKDGVVCLVRTENCERVGTYEPAGEKNGAIFAVDVTMDSQYVVTASADSRLVFYEFTGAMLEAVDHGGIMKYVEFNQKPGEQNMVVTCNDRLKTSAGLIPNRIMVWDFNPGSRSTPKLTIDSELPHKATKVKWGPFDETLVSIHEEGVVNVWSALTGERIHTFEAHRGDVTSLNFSEDRMLMITSSKDQSAKLWALDTDLLETEGTFEYELVKEYKTDRPLNDAAISPLYNAEKDRIRHVLLGGGQDAKDVTTTSGREGRFEALFYHMVLEEEIGSVRGHFGPLNTLAWFKTGDGFVTGGEDGYVRVHYLDPDYFSQSRKFD